MFRERFTESTDPKILDLAKNHAPPEPQSRFLASFFYPLETIPDKVLISFLVDQYEEGLRP